MRDADAARRETCIRIARDHESLALTLDEMERLAGGAVDDAEIPCLTAALRERE
jgi:hypothetical protein